MKKQLVKVVVIALIWAMIMTSVMMRKIYANDEGLNISIETDKETYLVGDEIEVKIKLNKKVMSASYYLNYNNSVLTYQESKTQNLAVKDYPSQKLLKSVYFDINGNGVDEIKLIFKVTAVTNEKISFSLTNTTMTTANDSKVYENDQIKVIRNDNIQVQNPQSEDNTNNTGNTVENTTNTEVNNTVENTTNTTANNKVENTTNTTANNKIENITNTTNTTANNKIENKNNLVNNNKNKQNKVNNLVVSSQTSKKLTDKTTSKNSIPKTGSEDIYKYLIIVFVIVTIYLGYNVIKLSKYF